MFFDGLCEPKNPGGVATYGFVLYKENVYLHSEYGLAAEPGSDNATNNVAEYTGMLKGLEWLVDKNLKEDLEIFGDSQLVMGSISSGQLSYGLFISEQKSFLLNFPQLLSDGYSEKIIAKPTVYVEKLTRIIGNM